MEIDINQKEGKDTTALMLTCVFKSPVEEDLIEKLEPVLSSMNFDLRDLEVIPSSKNQTVRVTIEHLDSTQNIGIEDCSKVHETIGPMFDVWDPIETAYTLEVSSPGEKAPLRTWKHFHEALNEEIDFKTTEFIEIEGNKAKPRKNWKGKLINVHETHIDVEDYLGVHQIPLRVIKSARCLHDWKK